MTSLRGLFSMVQETSYDSIYPPPNTHKYLITRPHYLLLFSLFFIYILNVTFDRIKDNPRGIIWSDAEGYYAYLPGLFIIRDFHKLPYGSMYPQFNDKGEFINKYSCGLAYFELPFFGIGYLISRIKGNDANDYVSRIYCRAIAFGGILITFMGLLFLYKVLIKEFKENVVLWTLLATFLGTNLFHYATKEMGMSHIYSFFLFTVLLFQIPRYLVKPDFLNSVLMGAVMGWIFLIRPTNALVFLLILLYHVYSLVELKERIKFLIRNYTSFFFIMLAGFVMMFPQLLYWKEMTGHWIYYSYTEESFIYWNKPKIMAVLFDVQNGLLLYSPMVIFMLVGIFSGLKQKKYHALAMLLIFCLATYLFASWWAWWFGGAFGHRCYVEYYAILAIPLAGLIHKVFSGKKILVKISFQGLLILLMIYSVRLSYLYATIGGPWDGPDWRWNWDKYAWIMDHFFKIF